MRHKSGIKKKKQKNTISSSRGKFYLYSQYFLIVSLVVIFMGTSILVYQSFTHPADVLGRGDSIFLFFLLNTGFVSHDFSNN